MVILAGLEVPARQEGDLDLTERQADYLQGFLTISGFDPLDDDALDVLSQEQASELLDQVETIYEGGYDKIAAIGRLTETSADGAAKGRASTLFWSMLMLVAIIFAVLLKGAGSVVSRLLNSD